MLKVTLKYRNFLIYKNDASKNSPFLGSEFECEWYKHESIESFQFLTWVTSQTDQVNISVILNNCLMLTNVLAYSRTNATSNCNAI